MTIVTIALIFILTGIISGVIIIIHLAAHPQKMWIMNLVWPITALYSGPLGLVAYFSMGRHSAKNFEPGLKQQKPFWQSVLTGALHCGGGCTLGDLLAALILLYLPVTLFGSKMYGEWLIELLLAFVIGIVFQYYAIKPMRDLAPGKAILAALKADTLSLIFWQVGMYGWMAIGNLLIFNRLLNAREPVFWMMMQIGMLFGLLTAYPINWWLLKTGVKERM